MLVPLICVCHAGACPLYLRLLLQVCVSCNAIHRTRKLQIKSVLQLGWLDYKGSEPNRHECTRCTQSYGQSACDHDMIDTRLVDKVSCKLFVEPEKLR